MPPTGVRSSERKVGLIKHERLFSILLLLLFFLAAGCSSSSSSKNGNDDQDENQFEGVETVSFSGYVVNGPLDAARVEIFNQDGVLLGHTYTNSDGSYEHPAIPEAELYRVVASGGLLNGTPYPGILIAQCEEPVCDLTPVTKASVRLSELEQISYEEAREQLLGWLDMISDPFQSENYGRPIPGVNLPAVRDDLLSHPWELTGWVDDLLTSFTSDQDPRKLWYGLSIPNWLSPEKFENPKLYKVAIDSVTLYDDQAEVTKRVHTIEHILDLSAKGLKALSTINSTLKQLESKAETLHTIAATATAIPQARPEALKVKDAIETTQANITAARTRLDPIVEKTDPIKEKLELAAKAALALELSMSGLNNGVVNNIPYLARKVDQCVAALPASQKECVSSNVDQSAGKVDNVINDYDKVMQDLLYEPEIWLPSIDFLDPINAELDKIKALEKEIVALYNTVKNLTSQLSTLNTVLSKSFSFSFPYPNPSWKKPWRVSHYKVTIGFKTIIEGANAIEKKIEHYLSGTLWKVLKKLGVSKYVNKLIDQANSAVKTLLDNVNFNVDLHLPNIMSPLDAIEEMEAELLAHLELLNFPSVDKELPGFGFPGINTSLDYHILYGHFPDGLGIDNCAAVTIGCD